MKKFFLILLLAFFFLQMPVHAATAPNIGLGQGGMASAIAQQAGYSANTTDTSLANAIGKVIAGVLGLAATIFFVLTIYAGILWMTAQGNDEQVGKAKGILEMAIIGMVIALAAYGITATVLIITGNATGYSSAPPATGSINTVAQCNAAGGSCVSQGGCTYVGSSDSAPLQQIGVCADSPVSASAVCCR